MKIFKKTLAAIAGLGLAIGMTTPANAAPLVTATKVGTNSAASAMSDPYNRSIHDLALIGDELYQGWGNYDTNIGPIKIMSHNVNTGQETHHFTLNGEEADPLRVFNGTLYVPDVDPKLSWSSKVGYATNAGGWHYVFGHPAQHIFDVAVLGSEIFMAGAMTNPDKSKYGPSEDLAMIVRSTDGGATWGMVKWRATPPEVGTSGYDRYYWLAVANGKLYASASVSGSPVLDVYTPSRGGKWTTVAAPGSVNGVYEAHAVEVFGSVIVGRSINNSMWIYDTAGKGKNGKWSSATLGSDGLLMDFYVDGSTIYALVRASGANSDDRVYASNDGKSWREVAVVDIPVPNWEYTWHGGEVTTEMRATATSIAVRNGVAYLGTNMGDIWKVNLP